MRRRNFIAVLGCAAAWPLAAFPQDPAVRRIGILMNYASTDAEAKARVDAFIAELAKLGWVIPA